MIPVEEIAKVRVKELADKGEAVYQRIRTKLEKKHWGKIVVIEPESGEHFLGETVEEASEKARKRYPGKLFFITRVGTRGVYRVPWTKSQGMKLEIDYSNRTVELKPLPMRKINRSR